LILIAGAAALIFAVDLMLPRGVAIPMLYVIPILIATDCRQRWFRFAVVAGCTGLTMLGYFFSAPGVPEWVTLSNRALAVTAIWTVAILAWQRTQAREQVDLLRNLLPMCESCHKVRDDQGYWNQVELYLETQTGTRLTHGICPDCFQKWYPDFYPQVAAQFPDLFKEASHTIMDEKQFQQAGEHP
jgi:hypothetical protein